MSVGTSDSSVISSPKSEAHNLSAINASAASRGDGSPATVPTTSPKKPSSSLRVQEGDHVPHHAVVTKRYFTYILGCV